MRLLLLNTHSALNSGDLAITWAELDILGALLPSAVTMTSRTPSIDQRVLATWRARVLPALIPAPSLFKGRGATLIGCTRNLLHLGAKAALVTEMRHCDVVISSGGGYFWSNRRGFPGPMFFQNYLHLHLARHCGKPIILFPQSFGPVFNTTACRILGRLLRDSRVTTIFAREPISLGFLSGLLPADTMKKKVELCGDVAFCLDPTTAHSDMVGTLDLPPPIIAVTVRQWDFPEARDSAEKTRLRDAYLEALTRACATVASRYGGSVVVFPQSRGPGWFEDDVPLSRRLTERLVAVAPTLPVRYLPLPEAATPFDVIRILSQVHLVVATRFHSAILGFLAGTPAVAIAYQPKSRGIMEVMGFDDLTVDISAVDADRLIELMTRVINAHETLAAQVQQRVAPLRAQIREKTLTAVRSALP